MSKNKSYAVLGLGIFGSTIAKKLSEEGSEVIAIDIDMDCVDRIKNDVSMAIQADITDINQLKDAGIKEVDCAIVATGSKLEVSVMAVMNLKELGISQVVAKAKNKKYKIVLERVGADRVIRPEKEMGERVARQILYPNVSDLIDVDEYTVLEVLSPKSWVNKSLIDLNLRNKFGINIIGIRQDKNSKLLLQINPNYKIEEENYLLIITKKDNYGLFNIE